MGRSLCCDKEGLKKGPWTAEEDQKLIDYIQKHGPGNWRTLPKNAGLKRCGKSCRLRWTNYLRPDIKRGRFSFEEEETIIQLHSVLGNKWSAIASRLPGRTDNEIKNYWNTHIRKRLLRMGIDPVTHSPRLDLLDLSSILNSTLYRSSQMNMSGCIGTTQPMINPEILKLASSLFTQNQNRTFSFQENQNQYQTLVPQEQFQQNPVQETKPSINIGTSNHTEFSNDEQHVMQPDQNQFLSNFPNFHDQIPELDEINSLQAVEDYANYLQSSYGYENCCVLDQTTLTNNISSDQTNQNLSFGSVFSTPSSSPTPFNSNSTYVCSTEDERDIYRNQDILFKFSDLSDVEGFM